MTRVARWWKTSNDKNNINVASGSVYTFPRQRDHQNTSPMALKDELKPQPKDDLVDAITLGLIESLKSHPNVCNVDVKLNEPASEADVLSWEQKFMCVLPSHLKNFYMCCNGLTIDWKYKIHRRKQIPLGHLRINSLTNLTKIGIFNHNADELPTLVDIESNDDNEQSEFRKPKFGTSCKIFELECLENNSRVCLVYHLSHDGDQLLKNPSIWYLDSALTWHFLAKGFLNYFRVLLAHMGLPLWQTSMTPYKLPTHTRNWFRSFAPLRFEKTSPENE